MSELPWLDIGPDHGFPIQNLPLGRAQFESGPEWVSRIENSLIRLSKLPIELEETMSPEGFRRMRETVSDLLRDPIGPMRNPGVLVPLDEARLLLPMRPPNFVDFYSGIHHASNVGRMFRPDQPPLLPNYRHLPVAYNGRASSVVASGTPIRRPWIQRRDGNDTAPTFEPTRELDFELELGAWVGLPSELGTPVPADAAEGHVLGVCLVNDWSARDGQRWEYQPLGPFLAKSFGTSVSPWIVSLDALAPCRVRGMEQDPKPLPHLKVGGKPHFDLHLEVAIKTKKGRTIISRTNASELYWSVTQQLAHMTSNGANLEVGDLIASGTISGQEAGTYGSLLELTWRGSRSLDLETGERRTFLEDGDTVILSGFAQMDGYRIGLGEVTGTILPAAKMKP